ncbi:MAG: hypothetical protein DWP97_00590 [Calditrichaeota bacterium]|nr:MAG: hypothetical protein DWP97_00590 [Calditrichota bacterium]
MLRKFLIIAVFFLCASTLQSQTSTPPADTIFNEIILTERGVVAVDTAGDDWYYDFILDKFVEGTIPQTEDIIDESAPVVANQVPVEERAINLKQIKNFKSNIIIESDEYVVHDIIATGRVTVKGWVQGNIRALDNRVLVTSTGQVDGDVIAPTVIIRDGGVVLGEIVEGEDAINFPSFPTEFSEVGMVVIIVIMFFMFVTIFMINALMPKKLQVIADCYNSYTIRNTLLGFLAFMMMPLVIALVVITIVGIPLALFVPLVYLAASIIGIGCFAHNLGGRISRRFLGGDKNRYFQTFVGFSIFAITWILGISLFTGNPEDSPEFGFGIFLFVLSIVITFVPFYGGIGASLLTRFGFKPYKSWKDKHASDGPSPAPAPPPIPTVPDINPPPPSPGPHSPDKH